MLRDHCRLSWLWVGVWALASAACASAPGGDSIDPVRVFAAASTTDALAEALADLRASGGPVAVSVVGPSSSLARQIEHGAPADLYLSADAAWMDHLHGADRIGADTRVDLLGNALVLVAPAGSAVDLSLSPGADLAAALGEGRLAVGDPDHVPAGRYARAGLEWLGAWDAVEPRLARAGDVRGAMAFVERGEAPLGIVYATDAAASERVRVVAAFPPEALPPVVYPLAIVAGSGEKPGVQEVYSHLLGPDAAGVFARHGFTRP